MKKWIALIAVLVLLVLLIPFPAQMKDGGTVHYNAIVYDIYDIHGIKPVDNSNEGGTFENAYIDLEKSQRCQQRQESLRMRRRKYR